MSAFIHNSWRILSWSVWAERKPAASHEDGHRVAQIDLPRSGIAVAELDDRQASIFTLRRTLGGINVKAVLVAHSGGVRLGRFAERRVAQDSTYVPDDAVTSPAGLVATLAVWSPSTRYPADQRRGQLWPRTC